MELIKQNNDVYFAHKIIGVFLFAGLIFWFLFNCKYGEVIQQNYGIGFDGVNYAKWVRLDFLTLIHDKILSPYYAHRILPSIVVRYASKLFNLNIGITSNLVLAYKIYNSILVICSTFFIWLISRHFKWKLSTFYICFAGVFFNYAILKMTVYDPVLTDSTAFLLGIITYYFYIKNRLTSLVITTIIGTFVWGSFLYMSIPLILFKYGFHSKVIGSTPNFRRDMLVGGFALCAVIFLVFVIHFMQKPPPIFDFLGHHYHLAIAAKGLSFNFSLLPISLLALFLYLFFSFRLLVDFSWLNTLLKSFPIFRFLIVIATSLLVNFFIQYLANSNTYGPSTNPLIILIFGCFIASLKNPLINIVSSVAYFGPMILLVIILWKNVAKIVCNQGIGLVIFISIALIIALRPESRFIINAFPVFFIAVSEILDKKINSWNFTYFFITICLITSRFWLKINYAVWDGVINDSMGSNAGNYLHFPRQMFFMSTGCWISDYMYYMFTFFTVILFILIYYTLQKTQRKNIFYR